MIKYLSATFLSLKLLVTSLLGYVLHYRNGSQWIMDYSPFLFLLHTPPGVNILMYFLTVWHSVLSTQDYMHNIYTTYGGNFNVCVFPPIYIRKLISALKNNRYVEE